MSIDKNSRAARQMRDQERRPAARGKAGKGRNGRSGRRRKRFSPWKLVLLIVAVLIAAAVGGAVYYVNHLLNLSQDVEIDMEQVMTNPNLDIETETVQKGFWKVAVFGVDSQDGNLGKGANSDVIIICSINRETGEIKMASVYRDTYLKVGEKNPYRKINEAYARGGPEQAIKALNENLDIAVDDFVAVNWKAVADAINNLGGIDIEITEPEFKYINSYITSVVENTGVYSQHLKKAGYQHLDGVQAVAYCRLRKMDTDFQRTERQRAVISQCLEKAKQSDLKVLHTVIGVCLPQVAHSFRLEDLLDLAKNISKYYLGDTTGFPFDLKTQNIGSLDCVVPVTLSSNVVKLHQFLFGTENYQPSDHVTRISKDIAYNSAKQADAGEEIHQEDIVKMSEAYKNASSDSAKKETSASESRDSETSADGNKNEKSSEEEEESRKEEEGTDGESDEHVPEEELIDDPETQTKPTESGDSEENSEPGSKNETESGGPGSMGQTPSQSQPASGPDQAIMVPTAPSGNDSSKETSLSTEEAPKRNGTVHNERSASSEESTSEETGPGFFN